LMKTKDCNGREFFLAVHDVFTENAAAGESGGHKAASERWTANSNFRRQLWERVRDRYCERTGCEKWCFWFSEDGVAEAYLRWRKAKDDDREATLLALKGGVLC